MKTHFIRFFCLFVIFSLPNYSQIRIKEAPISNFSLMDSVFIDSNNLRKIIPLTKDWLVHSADDNEKSKINVPSTFTGTETLIYETVLAITDDDISNYNLLLEFLGLNYSAEILVNNLSIFKHFGGEIPFSVEIPKDILNFGEPNKLTVKVSYNLDSETTLPIKPQFLFPENIGGIKREVYLKLVPKSFISAFDFDFTVAENLNSVKVNTQLSLQKDKYSAENEVSAVEQYGYSVNIQIKNQISGTALSSNSLPVALNSEGLTNVAIALELSSPILWRPASPDSYIIEAQLLQNGVIIDRTLKYISFYKLTRTDSGFTLNGEKFRFNGTTYFFSYPSYGSLIPIEQLERDLRIIKETGFNTVRFAKQVPHPYALRLCEKIGLMAFIELPINSVPGITLQNPEFRNRAFSFLRNFLKYYNNYSVTAAIGLGSSYLSNSELNINFLKNILTEFTINKKLSYASFIGLPSAEIEGLDFYGVEIYGENAEKYLSRFDEFINNLGISRIFISEATYPTFSGSTSGYLNKFSFESQAKYFSDLIDIVSAKNIPAFFINTMFDFKGSQSSFFAGYNDEHKYSIGLLNENRKGSRIAQKVVNSKLTGGERITIPIGNKKDDAPVLFIILGVLLSVILTLLINSKRKFREDASRAFLRPYNFYADIRDHRILSGFHTIILMIVLAGAHSLLVTNLLYFLKSNVFLEKLLIAFGSPKLSNFISLLAWDHIKSLMYMFILSILFFLIVTLLIKAASFFIKTRVLFSSVFFTVIWSFLPLAVLIPLELVLYRILLIESFNIYIYIFLVVYLLWVLQRVIKGIYVIFDIRPIKVYFYSFLVLLITAGGTLFYLQLSNSTINLILLAYRQFKLI